MVMLNQSTAIARVFWLGSGLSGSGTFKVSKNGAAFASPTSGTVTSLTNGFYSISLSATDTNTLGDLAYLVAGLTGTVTQPQADTVYASPWALLANNGTVNLSLNSIAATNAGGPALSLSGTTFGVTVTSSAGPAISAVASGAQDGVTISGGATGMSVTGAAGYGLFVTGTTFGVEITSAGTGVSVVSSASQAVVCQGVTGGVVFQASAGDGFDAVGLNVGFGCSSSAGTGLFCAGSTSGLHVTAAAGSAIIATGTGGKGATLTGTAGAGLSITGSTDGVDIVGSFSAGISVTGANIGVSITGTANNGLQVTGGTSGAQIVGTTGQGVLLKGTPGALVTNTNTAIVSFASTAGLSILGVGAAVQVASDTGPAASLIATAGDGVDITASVNAIALTSGSGDGVDYNGTDLLTAVANALLNAPNGVETGYTPKQAWRLMLSALCSLTTVAGAVRTFRDVNNTVNRIVATTDVLGQRLTITLTP